jgi:MFS family permease
MTGFVGRRNVWLLAVAQALFTTATATVVTSSALAGRQLAPDGLATLPFALQFVTIMLVTMPTSLLMQRFGRRVGFVLGAAAGSISGLGACWAVLTDDFILFCAASAGFGLYQAAAMYYRFAAVDATDENHRARAISYVMAGGVVAAVVGPELAKATNPLFAPILFAGCFLAVAVLGVAALAVVAMVRLPARVQDVAHGEARPLALIWRQPTFQIALAAGALAQGVMVLLMTAAPLAMAACGLTFDDTAFAIQWHVLGMFAPSFVTGRLIHRFGRLPIMLTGCGLLFATLAVHLSGVALIQFWAGLVLLGLGWNFLFVGATDLLTTTYRPAEKAKVQGLNDLTVFTTAAVGSMLSGLLDHLVGWQAVNLGFAPLLLALVAALLWLRRSDRRQAAAVAAE